MDNDWFYLGSDGQIHNIGPQESFDAADSYCCDRVLEAVWIIDPKTAQNWIYQLKNS